jgi:hypothetical protein
MLNTNALRKLSFLILITLFSSIQSLPYDECLPDISELEGMQRLRLQDTFTQLRVNPNESFVIYSFMPPYDDHTWRQQDCWTLEFYSNLGFELLGNVTEIHDSCLCQWWYFKARSSGTYKFIFKQYLSKIKLEILVV